MFVRGVYIILCLPVVVKCALIKVPTVIDRNNVRSSYNISAHYADKKFWILNKDIPTIVELSKKFVMIIDVLTIARCTLEHIEKGALDKYADVKEIEIYENSLKEIKSGVVGGEVRRANFRRNKIKHIEESAFNNLPNLREVLLGSNQIEEINPHWFSNCPELTVLNLHDNKIKHITRDSFDKLTTINSLKLDYNKISSIGSDAFKDLPNLKNLGLSFNQITVLPPDIFPRIFAVEYLDISFNHINYISTETLSRLLPRYIHIIPNPWKCECLDSIENWLMQKKFRTSVYSYCNGPQYPICVKKSLDDEVCDEKFDMKLSTKFYEGYWNVCNKHHFDFSDKELEYKLDVLYE